MENKGKVIYNLLVSILMGYFLVRSLICFYEYSFFYRDKLNATYEIQTKLTPPATVEQLKATVKSQKVQVIATQNSQEFVLKGHTESFTDLPKAKGELLSLLNSKLSGNVEVQNTRMMPPEKSKRVLRLELTVYIPAFLFAIFWFIYLYKWINEIRATPTKTTAKSNPA